MIGERFHDLRKDKGITQEVIAQHLGLTKYTISSYENEKSCPNDEIKVAIAKYFNVSVDYLLGLIDDPLPYHREQPMMLLPDDLPETAIASIKDYIGYIIYKNNEMKGMDRSGNIT